ncbi:unnamed protein product [Clavelina lepadiformis]|uniref:tRNA N(3)-methylcytidine methyltransferase n=1 Tax=Clavelina lepadiformis TaxID=159417 RepID=A0ABP0GCJ4_CLALP
MDKQLGSCDERILTEDEINMLKNQDKKIVSEFKSIKLENEAKKMWDLFYKRNSTNFFKDRHWTSREFDEIKRKAQAGQKITLLEAGCGVGNAIFPLLDEMQNLFVYACDFSPRAVEFVKENRKYNPDKCFAFQCDLTAHQLNNDIPEASIDIATLIFVLSAIHPDKFLLVLQNIHKVLKPGGHLLFRDYGLYDWAMLRFNPGSKISENFYVRQDGTRAYYFEKEQMKALMEEVGFNIISNDFVRRETVNKKKELTVPRVFLQGKYTKR